MTDYREKLRRSIGIKPKIEYYDGVITVRSLKDRNSLRDFIRCVVNARHDGLDKIAIDFLHLKDEIVYPSICVSISAFLENLKQADSILFEIVGAPDSISKKHIFNPVNPYDEKEIAFPINKVWSFSDFKEAQKIVSAIIEAISEAEVFEQKDIIRAIEWCVNEVVDNVVRHAETRAGYLMCQIHGKSEKQIVFSVADAGCGIYESLRSGGLYEPSDGYDAITLALKKGVSRSSEGQGNGLWGLGRILQNNKGILAISTFGCKLRIDGDGEITKDSGSWLTLDKGGTVVDFQFHYDQPISLADALDGHEPESIQYINAWSSNSQAMVYKIADSPLGTGTRPAGAGSRKYMMNIIKQNSSRVIVDFEGVGVVASSFADEMIAKVFTEMGPIKFQSSIQLANMNETVTMIVNRAIEQRMVQDKYQKYIGPSDKTEAGDIS